MYIVIINFLSKMGANCCSNETVNNEQYDGTTQGYSTNYNKPRESYSQATVMVNN